MFNDLFFFFLIVSCVLWDNADKYYTAGQATDENMVHAYCTLNT